MAGDEVFHPFAHVAAAGFGGAAVDDHGEGVHGLHVDHDRHFHQVAFAVADLVVIEAGIAAGDGFQAIVEIEHDFVEWKFIDDLGAAAHVRQVFLDAAAILAEFQDTA